MIADTSRESYHSQRAQRKVCATGSGSIGVDRMTKFEIFMLRAHFAWAVMTGKYEVKTSTEKKLESCLFIAMSTLQSIGKRQHGGSVDAREMHEFITKHALESDLSPAW